MTPYNSQYMSHVHAHRALDSCMQLMGLLMLTASQSHVCVNLPCNYTLTADTLDVAVDTLYYSVGELKRTPPSGQSPEPAPRSH